MPLTIGTQLGSLKITGLLGKGGMGEVYRARDTKLKREVAIKILPEEFSRDPARVSRFQREAEVLASLNHPNIAAIYDLQKSEETCFLVLELVEGETLAERIQRGPIPIKDSIRLALQMAQAVEAAHDNGVIHRDIKPANIKITPDGKVKVLDFGLAKAFVPAEFGMTPSNLPTVSMAATQQGIILGTAAYMSPEQASGEAVDKRADIWSFGVVLFEMLTGRRMFTGKTVSHVLAEALKAAPDWNCLPANLHPRVRLLLQRCLEKEPRDRYHDIADARVDLQYALSDPRGVLVDPLLETDSARRARGLWSSTLSVAAAVVIAGGLGWFLHRGPEARPGPVFKAQLLLPDSTQFSATNLSMLAISSDGSRIAYSANSQLYLRNLSEVEGHPVHGTSQGGTASSPVFSPDGQWLAYVHLVTFNGPFIVKRVPITGGTPVPVFESSEPAASAEIAAFEWGLTWPTMDALVFATSRGILRIPANGGTTEVLVKRGEGEVFESPQILPGGKQVLFVRLPASGPRSVARWDDADIVIQSIGENDRTVVWKGGSHPRYLPTGQLIYARGNTLFALSVDLPTRKHSGAPIRILEGVQRSSNGFSDAAQYAVSDTGTLVTIPGFAADPAEKNVLAMLDRNGLVTALKVRPAQYRSPRLSPDGGQLAVEIIGDDGISTISIYDMSGKSEIRRLTENGKNGVRPIWVDNKHVAFGSNRGGSWGIYEQPADGSTLPVRLTTAKDKDEHYPESWSPDGKTLAFVVAVSTTDWNLWTFSRDSNRSVMVAGGLGNQFGSAFSTDGKWLIYTDNQDPFGIRALSFPPTGVGSQITQDGEAWPIWSKKGEVFFRLRRDATGPPQLGVIDVTTSGGFTSRNPRNLQLPKDAFIMQGERDYDATSNGDKFVIIVTEKKDTKSSPPTAALHIDVVLNWFEELNQLLRKDHLR